MALTPVTGAPATWWLANRNGGLTAGTVYDCTVNDLAVGDFLCGSRAIVGAGLGVTGTTRTVPLTRVGSSLGTVSMVGASTLRIIR